MDQAVDKVKNIVAAVGKFPQDNPVLKRAAEIARSHAAKLTIVHVVDSLSGFELASLDIEGIEQQMLLDTHESVKVAVARRVEGVREVDIRIETGSPSRRLNELITETTPDLVVMRAHQGNSILKKIIGSTTDRVIRSSRIPVLVVKRPAIHDYQQIVASIDTSDNSTEAAPFVAALFPSAGLSLIHFVQIPHQFESAMLRAGSGKSVAARRDALISKAKDSLRDLSGKLPGRLTTNIVRVIVGDPAKSLVQATWNRKVDLIVVGAGSAGKIRQALLGSVTQRVLRDAACDVLICRI